MIHYREVRQQLSWVGVFQSPQEVASRYRQKCADDKLRAPHMTSRAPRLGGNERWRL
jgi:hypothetical protein